MQRHMASSICNKFCTSLSKPKEDERHPVILYYFNYLHIFFLSPVWLQWDSHTLTYIHTCSQFRKVMCAVIITTEISRDIFHLFWRNSHVGLTRGDYISGVFGIVSGISFVACMWSITFNMIFRTSTILKWVSALKEGGLKMKPFPVKYN